MISETVQRILKEYGDFDDVPLSHKSSKLSSYGSEPVTDYFKEKYENAKKDDSPMGYFKFRFLNPVKRQYMVIKSISYKKLQCLKNDLEEKFGETAQCSDVLPCKPFSDEERKNGNFKIEYVYDVILGDEERFSKNKFAQHIWQGHTKLH